MTRRHTLRWLLAVSVLAIVSAVLVTIKPWSRTTEARASTVEDHGEVATLASQVGSMERQLSDLVRRVEELEVNRSDVREPLLPQPEAAAVQPGNSLVDLAQRVSRLERVAVASQPQVARRADPAHLTASQEPTSREQIAADHNRIRNPDLSDADKAHAWADLAHQRVYPWTDDIIADMTSIGLSSKDDRAREVVWIGAESEFRSDLLVQPLVSALADPVADVREEAADALSQYLDVPGVRSALGWTSNYDESEDVRNEATKALRGEE